MTPDLARKYAAAVPRYTSYPTAPHFSPSIGAADYHDWLARLDAADAVSLILHIPFCNQLCWYCGCSTKMVARYSPVATQWGVAPQLTDA